MATNEINKDDYVYKLTAKDFFSAVPGASKGVGSGILGYLQRSGQGFFRGTAGLASLGMRKPLTPSTPFQKALYGTDKPITLRSVGEEYGAKGMLAPVVGATVPALDLIPGGKVTKTGATKILKAVDNSDDAIRVLKGLLGMSDDVAKKFGPQLAKTADTTQITKLINSALKESQSVQRMAQKAVTTTKGLKERKYVTSARKVIPNANKLAGQYVPRSTDELAIKAKNLVNDNPFQAENLVRSAVDSGKVTDTVVATASEYIKKLGQQADLTDNVDEAIALNDKAAEMANLVAKELTELGRSVQAASILGRLTPEGQLRFAAREIQRYNELNPTKKVAELSGEQAGYIRKEMNEIQNMEDSLDKSMRLFKLQSFISDLVPTSLYKKMVAVWKAGLLTGIKTSGLNLFSNITHNVSEIVKDLPAAAVDSVASLFTGERTKVFTIRRAFDGIKEGSIKGVRYFATGFDERNIGAKIDYKRVNFGKGKVAKAFQTYTDTVFRALAVGDQPFYYASAARSLMDQALAQGMNQGLKGKALVKYAYKIVEEPTEEMVRIATADASTAVFINQTIAGKAAAKIQSLPGGEFIIPFGRTPSSVAMQAIAYSPVGAVATLVRNIGKGKFNQRDFSQGLGRGLTGTAAMYIGMKLAESDMVAPPYPVGDEKEQKLQEAEGIKNGYILIDGKWRSPLVLGPAGVVVQAGGFLQQAINNSGSPTEAAVEAFATAGKAFLELPFLTGLEDFINALTDPKRYAKGYLPGLAASFIPTIVADVARAADPTERVPSDRTLGGTIKTRFKSRIPWLRKTLQPRVTILGQELERAGNTLEVMIDPTRPSQSEETPVTMEFQRLHNEGFRVSPTALGDKYGFKNMTKEENTRMWILTGQLIDQKVTNLIASDWYQNATDEQRAKTIESFVSKAKLNARATIVAEITVDLQGEELRSKLGELKEGGLITQDVYSKYLEIR